MVIDKHPLFYVGVLCLAVPSSIWAQSSVTPDQEAFFEKNIRPAFVKYCYECHSLESGKTRGGLLVDTRDGLHQGGDSGAAIIPGNLQESVLWGAITWAEYEMPPKVKMPSNVIDKFKQWIEMGAPDPRVREKLFVESKVDIAAGKKHWAFQKPRQTARGGIDVLVSAKLHETDMTPVASANALTLLRRLNFDLIGLPPTPEESIAFQATWKKDSKAAIEAKVDELLKRPQFGERWGRHWLDVARYAESSGKDVNFTFPHAWRYRDYVYDAFNDDKPYDEFIREQIAGDLLPIKSDEEWQEHLIATGFLAIGTKGLNERNPRQFRMDLIDEQIDTMSQAILGITVACARCHDHKIDPIPTTDYYALAGIFLSTKTFYGTVSGLQNQRPSSLLLLPLIDKEHLTRSYSQTEIEQMRERIGELQTSMRTQRAEARRSGAQVEQRKMLALRNQIARVEGILSTLTSDGVPQSVGMGVQDARPINAHVLARGDVEKPAQEVERGFLQVLDDVGIADIQAGKSGRRELADWLVSKENPLTARVMVNRLWMHLFGDGLVATPNNWGLGGQQPTHPELLDYLAIRFMKYDWSVKSMIREIVLSDTYQRSSEFNQDNYASDSDNTWLWRANPRQVDAEALRDSILNLGGKLDLRRPQGSEIAASGDKRVGRLIDQGSFSPFNHHRSAYLPILRNDLPEVLELFDFADPSISNAKRETTNVPSQALYLMNSKFVTEQAQGMAMQLWDRFDNTNERVRWAFLQAYGRPATESEFAVSIEFLKQFKPDLKPISARTTNQFPRRRSRPSAGNRPPRGRRTERVTQLSLTPEQQTLAMFCQTLMASAEFRILN